MNNRVFARLACVITMGLLITACSGGSNSVFPQQQTPAQTLPGSQSNAAIQIRYRLVDLGTFGGPASSLNNGNDGIFNNEGTLAGWADTALPDPSCFTDCFSPHAFKWSAGVMTDLGTLPGGTLSQAAWISANGLIAGNSDTGKMDPSVGFPEFRAVLFSGASRTDLGHLPGGFSSFVTSVNARGQVTGLAFNGTPDPFSLFLPGIVPTQTRAFVWQNGVMTDIGTLGGPDAVAGVINEAGEIAGQSYTNSTPNATSGLPTAHAFFWKNGVMTDIPTFGGTLGAPNAMNDRGEVVGVATLPGDVITHPYLWYRGRLTDLGTLGGDNGVTNWINENGDIAGKADLPGAAPQNHDAVLWRHGSKIDLGTVGGDACSNAYFVNSRGQVVGTSENAALCRVPTGQHAFLWESGGPMIDLNTLIPPGADLKLTFAFSINNSGEIAGVGLPAGCTRAFICGRAYVLIPCNPKAGAAACTEQHANGTPSTMLRSTFNAPAKLPNNVLRSPWLQCRRSTCAGISG